MASTYQQVAYGSSGEAVRQLQRALNQQGYSLDEDGVFGVKTRSAVKSYQKKNTLRIDGIAGPETWGALLAVPETPAVPAAPRASVSPGTARALAELEGGVTPSVETELALRELQDLQEQQPGAYRSDFRSQLNELYARITGRREFSYDPDSDETYQQYARQYARQGRRAMTDTLGRAAALTGGYGSSYAQSAAQQAYDQYLTKLSDVLPQLQQNAYSIYRQQGDALLRQYELLRGQEEGAYARWRDAVGDWQKQVSQASDAYETATAADLKNYQTLLNYYADKAAAERKLTASGVELQSGPAAEKPAALSGTAAESIRRTLHNYLKSGQAERAKELLRQYEGRMSAAQRQRMAELFSRYSA